MSYHSKPEKRNRALVKFPLLCRLRLWCIFYLLCLAWAGLLRDSRGQTVIVRGSRVDHDHALAGNDIFPDVFAVIAATHFDDDHDLAKLAVNFHVAQPDDVIGEERDRIVAEGKPGKRIV